MAGVTPSQTVGPYFSYGLASGGAYPWSDLITNDLVTTDVAGERIRIEGRVTDGDNEPIDDALVEIWQADAQGRYAHPRDNRSLPNTSFRGFGRCATDLAGSFSFRTIKPGPVPGPNGQAQAPHVLVCYFSRGLLTHMYTRIYFEDEPANESDPILRLVSSDRRHTLIARREQRGGEAVYRFDIHVQGENETVFFDL